MIGKILIIDDDPTLVDFLKLLLESEGYDTLDAADGISGLDLIHQQNPELVLLDYMMPNMHGLDVLRTVSRKYESSFVVMLTGKGSEEVAVECMKAGALDYVVKPFDNDRLLSVVRNAFRLRELELEKRKLHEQMQRNMEFWNEKRGEITRLLARLQSIASGAEAASVINEIRKLIE
jgi:DNA-binding response OmpR family regulator